MAREDKSNFKKQQKKQIPADKNVGYNKGNLDEKSWKTPAKDDSGKGRGC